MAIYNLNYSKLESLLDRSFSPGTENAIIDAIKSAGIVTPGSGKIGVEIENTSGAYTVASGTQNLSRHRREQRHHGDDQRSRTDCGG